MLEKTYQPAEIEPRIHAEWERADAFKAGRPDRANAQPYCIVIPPPNVTGSLHMGHALNNTLQDVLCRFERMRGKDVLWQPGTDHAGIATQMVVERQMMERQEPDRRTIGREKFVEKVWAWKEESGSHHHQSAEAPRRLVRLEPRALHHGRGPVEGGPQGVRVALRGGADLQGQAPRQLGPEVPDGDLRPRGGAGRGARHVRVDLPGDPEKPFDAEALGKALARNPSGHMYHFRYPLAAKVPGYDKDYIVVATTRPETMLGDTGVAVHPEDERYAALIKAGAKVKLPLVGREIPIVADEYSDPEKGTGAVKITPAHDFNDFEVGKRHGLEQINVLDDRGRINDVPPPEYRGLDRFEARKRIVADLMRWACSRRSSRRRTPCRTATAPTPSSSRG